LLGVALFVPVIGGLYTRRAGTPEALASIAAGIGTLLAVTYTTGGRGFSDLLNPNLLGLVAAAIAFLIVMAVRRSPSASMRRAR
jgi:SSS family solute:Na+ symporter